MNKTLKTISIIVGILIIITIPFITTYNKMVTLDQNVQKSQSDIDTQLQRRNDLIPNLVETVKGYAKQEKDIFTDIANARAKLGGAQTVADKAEADNELSSALSRLLVVVERYPELKSNENFKDLTIALEGTENRINIARQDYNKAVDNYNIKIRKFPNSIVSGIAGFEKKPYYKASEGAKEVPKVNFSE
ncbi:LemA family protein [Clostridium acetireducens DSM 10703]|jgi:LemA protein|uniref:LemA family protein n=1 Tax=Clostridium acetireducens DSM 10703 TaxID=1121290 RepID=A0A1E8EVP8_9CLOT|nr:LemA family protein [Clostridium acetireducens]OFI01335.1 LemA family protein [Clostridium acetireducens DSM 10703]